ncbi:FtsX-like permease family protein [Candidatus Saccharibacteria bacterium]|nr:FtsX-like permease family protein [Candidatus Saccharibacteria bacterium]
MITKRQLKAKVKTLLHKLDLPVPGRVRRNYLLKLALKNLKVRRARSLVTIGGVGVGFGIIVFLVSLGYGLENLVIKGVATFEELRVADVLPEKANITKINDEVLAKFAKIDGTEKTLPAVSVAGKVSYQESRTDIVTVAAEEDFLRLSRAIPSMGSFFTQSREAVVNEATLRVLGIDPANALEESFDLSFIVTSALSPDFTFERQETDSTPYKIVGVYTGGENRPKVYVPLGDLVAHGVQNYTQAKVVAVSEGELSTVRRHVENMGFVTTSVVDTIQQIQSIFSTVRFILSAFGLAALIVAAFGMFNTLSVSLLERTREVALLQALGMYAREVKELFLIEALVMSLAGGVLGLILGVLGGIATSIILSALSLVTGGKLLMITTLPFYFIVVVLGLAVVVGILTGIYPARRSTKISALDALRYE